MKILWLTNLRLPIIDEILGIKANFFGGGWLSGLLQTMMENGDNEIVLCYPEFEKKEPVSGSRESISFYGFPVDAKKNRLGLCSIDPMKSVFVDILKKEKPDVIHIHGTEFQYSYAMAKAAEDVGCLDKAMASIQGMVSVYAHHFYGNLPRDVKLRKTVKEWIISGGADDGYRAFVRRGKYEIETIKLLHHVLGRTSWDYINCVAINPDIKYHKSNETLRKSFYSGEWKYTGCDKHTVFVSQAGTILKGFHKVVEAAEIVKKFYSDIKICVAGPKIMNGNWIKGNSYGLYIRRQVTESGLADHIEFLGLQNEQQMKEQMLKANVYVATSSIENSPNSLGEAMLLGMPCVTSDVGGVSDLIVHNKEGYVYPADSADLLSFYIMKVFSQKEKAEMIGKEAQKHARVTHDAECNAKGLMRIYEEIANG